MASFKVDEEICRLCLNVATDRTMTVINDGIKEILDLLLLKLNFNEKSRQVVCNVCFDKLSAAFEFKSRCIYINSTLMPYVYRGNMLPLDLRNIYMKKMELKHLPSVVGNQNVCRLCMELVTGEFVLVREVDENIIHSCIPEIDFSFTRDPQICKMCFDSLSVHSGFLKSTLNAQREIVNKTDYNVKPFSEVWLTSKDFDHNDVTLPGVCVKSEETRHNDMPYSDMCIKTEETDQNDVPTSEVRVKNEGDIKTNRWGSLNVQGEYENVAIDKQAEGAQYFEVCVKSECVEVKLEEEEQELSFGMEEDHLQEEEFKQQRSATSTHQQAVDNCEESVYQYQTEHISNLVSQELRCGDASQDQMYKCKECNYQTKYKNKLMRHQLRHKDASEVQMFKCGDCDFQTKYKNNLESHRLKHKDTSEIETYKCGDCDFQTKYKSSLLSHQLKHRDELEVEMYKCGVCDYQTRFKYKLVRHQLKHKDASEVQRYKCDECAYQTQYKYKLVSHQLKHRDASEVQMYKCNECEYQTKYKGTLTRHQLKHKDASEVPKYKCKECDFQTTYKSNLEPHQLKHKDASEIQMYKCSDCDFQTKYKSHLASHRLKHKDTGS